MQQYDISHAQETFRSHVRITCQPNKIPRPHVQKLADGRYDVRSDEDLVEIDDWRWEVKTDAKDQPTRSAASEAGKVEGGFTQALNEAKAELARQYQAAGIAAAELAHLDHLA